MSPSTITLIFLAFAIISFVLEKIPLGLTATIVAIGLNLTGVLSTSDTFAGYVNSNVILCVGMFVVGQALFETGMANKIGSLVTKFAKTERMLIIAIMVIVGIMSGFLSNTGTADVYYKLYFRDVSGELADVLEVTLTDGSDVLYTGTLAGLTRSTAATAPTVLAVGRARTLQASFHCPENTGNAAQQARMSFVLCADAVQTKNNPTGLFD